MARRAVSYWERRKAQELYENLIPAEEAAEELLKLYYLASKEVEREALKIVKRFQLEHKLTAREAERLLNSVLSPGDIRVLQAVLRQDPRNEALVAELESQAYAARINQLATVQNNIDQLVMGLVEPLQDKFQETLTTIADRSYYQAMLGLNERMGASFPISPLDPQRVQEILQRRWSGKNYSERIWGNTEALAESVKREMMLGVLTGKSRTKMAQAIQDEFGSASYQTRRLIRTEGTYVCGQIDLETYREMGVTEYEYQAILDSRTSEICRELDGKRFPVASAQPGVNYPPMHPWCRSTTTPALDKRLEDLLKVVAYDDEGNQVVRTLTEDNAARAERAANPPEPIARAEQIGDYSNDRGQYNRYVDRLGDRAPATFEEFSEMKHSSDPELQEKFNALQEDYRYTGILTRLAEGYDDLRSFGSPGEIPESYSASGLQLTPKEVDAVQHYSHWEEGVEMTRAYVGDGDARFTPESAEHFNTTVAAIDKMSLPENTVVYRGTSSGLIDGWEDLPANLSEWKGKEIGTRSLTSTSLLRDASYAAAPDKDVIMVINIPGGVKGAGYIEPISYNKTHGLTSEYEVLLQTESRYNIKEVQIYKGKTIVTVDWKGGTPTWVSPGNN